jgi:uncharacterized protein (TIGR00369 family)
MERPPYHAVLRPEPVAVDAQAGTVVIRLPYREEFRRAPGEPGYHGGVIAALIDLAGHAAVAVKVGRMAPTIDLRIDSLRAPAGGDLTARGKLLRAGRSIARADVEIVDDNHNVVAVGRGTYSTL